MHVVQFFRLTQPYVQLSLAIMRRFDCYYRHTTYSGSLVHFSAFVWTNLNAFFTQTFKQPDFKSQITSLNGRLFRRVWSVGVFLSREQIKNINNTRNDSVAVLNSAWMDEEFLHCFRFAFKNNVFLLNISVLFSKIWLFVLTVLELRWVWFLRIENYLILRQQFDREYPQFWLIFIEILNPTDKKYLRFFLKLLSQKKE